MIQLPPAGHLLKVLSSFSTVKGWRGEWISDLRHIELWTALQAKTKTEKKAKKNYNYFVVVSSEKNLSWMPYKCTHVEAKGQSCVSSFMVFTLFWGQGLNESEARWLPRDVWLVNSRNPPVSTTAVLGLQVLPWHPVFHMMQGIKHRLSCFRSKHLANFTPSSAWKSGFSMWKSVILHISQQLID